jgi:hypothetical protein
MNSSPGTGEGAVAKPQGLGTGARLIVQGEPWGSHMAHAPGSCRRLCAGPAHSFHSRFKSSMNLFSNLPDPMDRGLNWRRLRVLLKSPQVLYQNLRFHWIRTVSTQRHIFVVGPPRSGTTLMKNLLRGHSKIASVDGETFFFLRRNYTDFSHSAVAPQRMQELIEKARDAVHLFDLFAREVAADQRFVEKTPAHATRVGFILRHFPEARVVFTVRDGRDGYLSALRNPGYRAKLKEAGPVLKSYAEVWKTCVAELCRYGDRSAVLHVDYETLCADPEPQLRSVMEFLEEPFETAQLDTDQYGQTPKSQKRSQKRLNERISAKTVGDYRSEMSRKDIRAFQAIAGRELQAMGYELL